MHCSGIDKRNHKHYEKKPYEHLKYTRQSFAIHASKNEYHRKKHVRQPNNRRQARRTIINKGLVDYKYDTKPNKEAIPLFLRVLQNGFNSLSLNNDKP